MSKETSTKTSKESFNYLDSPYGDGMKIDFTDEFTDEFKEDFSANKTDLKENDKDFDEAGNIITSDSEDKSKDVFKKDIKEEVKKDTPKEESKDEESKEETSGLKHFASWLGEKGLVDYDEETFEDSEEGLKKLMSSTVEREVKNYKDSLPEDFHKLLEFVEAGGDPKDFMSVYYNDASWNDFEVDSDVTQKIALRELMKMQGEDAEDIEETLDTYEVSGILEKKGKLALTKLRSIEKNQQDLVFESQKKYDAEQKVLMKKQYEDFKSNLYKKEEIQGFKLTPKVKDHLWEFMMKTDKQGKTGLQKHNETNEDAQLLYAYLAMNDWNLSKLEVQVKTKVASELSNKLSNFKDGRTKLKSGQSDNFNKEKETGNFSAFKQAINQNLI